MIQPTTPSGPPEAAATSTTSISRPASAGARATPSPHAPAPTEARAASAPPYRRVLGLDDDSGDQGLDGPAYGDLLRLEVADDGEHARITLVLRGTLPARTAAHESVGLGVNFYAAPTQASSDYQLFADGEPDGWFAYLDTPRGFVRYPGNITVDGRRLLFTVPWSSLGGRRSGYVSAFADWTDGGRTGTLGGNAASSDGAPRVGTSAYHP